MAEGFPATSNFETMLARGPVGTGNDPVAWLPDSAAVKLRALRQHTDDARALLPDTETMNALRAERASSTARLKRLRDPAQAGGFGIKDENNQSVIDERARLDGIEAELDRLTAIDNVRSEKWRAAGGIVTGVEGWLRTGIPDGSTLVAVDDPPLAEILRKNERADDAIDRLARRRRELIADRHRIASAPFPSSVAKARVADQINALADSAVPYTAGCVEHLDEARLAERQMRAMVYNVPNAPGAIAQATETDAVGLIAWLMRDVLIERLHREIDEDSDDEHALSAEQRREQQAVLDADLLDVEREVAALTWQMRRDGAAVEFDKSLSPLAIIGVTFAPRQPTPPGFERTSFAPRR